jgi:hypothetical protein
VLPKAKNYMGHSLSFSSTLGVFHVGDSFSDVFYIEKYLFLLEGWTFSQITTVHIPHNPLSSYSFRLDGIRMPYL